MKKYQTLIFLLLGIVFLSVVLLRSLIGGFDFTTTGQIGDTIGGILSPLMSLIGALLVYVSFREQLEANKIQREALAIEVERSKSDRELDLIMYFNAQIRQQYNDLTYTSMERGRDDETYTANDALEQFNADLINVADTLDTAFSKEYIYFLNCIDILVDKIRSSKIDSADRKFIFASLRIFYLTIISETYIGTCEIINSRQGLKEDSRGQQLLDFNDTHQFLSE